MHTAYDVVRSCVRIRRREANTHRRRQHDSAVELSRVGGVNAPVGTRQSSPTQFTISCAVELLRLVTTSDDIMTSLLKRLSISIKIGVIKPLWSLFGQFPNCRPNPSAVVMSWLRIVFTPADTDATQLDS